MPGPALRALRSASRPTLVGATVAVGMTVPAVASAAPFDQAFQNQCLAKPAGDPAGFAKVIDLEARFVGEVAPVREGGPIRLAEGSKLVLTPSSITSLTALGDKVDLSLAKADLGLSGADGVPLRPFVARWGDKVVGTVDPSTPSYEVAASDNGGQVRPTATADSVTVRYTGLTGKVVATTGGATTTFTLECAPAPGGDTTITTAAVEPVTPPRQPFISGLSERSAVIGTGASFVANGSFDGPISSVDVGGSPATFQKLSHQRIRVDVPDLGYGDNRRVRVTTAGGESPDTVSDDFDILPSFHGETMASVVSRCVGLTAPGWPVGTLPEFDLTTKVRVAVPLSLKPGDAFNLRPTVTFRFGEAAVETLRRGGIIVTARPTLQSLRFGVSGTATSSLELVPSPATLAPFGLQHDSPVSIDAPVRDLAAGQVTAPGGGSVVLSVGAFQLSGDLFGTDPLDGLGSVARFDYVCTPEAPTIATIAVTGPTPTVTPTITPTVTPTITPTVTPTRTPSPTLPPEPRIDVRYGLSGTAALKTLTTGSLPLSGSLAATFLTQTGTVFGDLAFAPTTGKLTALGFLPVTAKVNLVPTDQFRGTLRGQELVATAKVRIKLPSVKAIGIELAGGANCQAKQITSLTLKSTQATFRPSIGGALAGTFSISDLSGCGFLTGLVSPLTQGSGNALALQLTPVQ